jgi:hypothetical protein
MRFKQCLEASAKDFIARAFRIQEWGAFGQRFGCGQNEERLLPIRWPARLVDVAHS